MRNFAGLHHESAMKRFSLIRKPQATLLGLFVLLQGFSQLVAQGGTDLNISVIGRSSSSVTLNWNITTETNIFYRIEWLNFSVSNIANTPYTITGLTAGLNYTFKVTGVDANNTVRTSGQIRTFTYPNAVSNLSVSVQNTSSVSLTWSEPQGSWFLFTVEWTYGTDSKKDNTSKTSYVINGLTAGGKYTFNVTPVAADLQTTGPTTQVIAFTKPDVVTNLTILNTSTSSIFLTWNLPQGNWSFFTVEWTDGATGSVQSKTNITDTSYTITGLTAGVYYKFNVTAIAADGKTAGAPAQSSTFTKSDVVTNLTVSQKNTSSVSLNWNEPAGSRAYFTVELNSTVMCNTTNMSCTITGLTPGVNYTFNVSTFAGDGTAGTSIQISTFTSPNVVPSFVVSERNTSSVSLTWNETVGSRAYFTVELNSSIVCNTKYKWCTITGLTAGVKYTFKITAVAGDGRTRGASTEITSFTKPNVVTNLNVSQKTTSSVSLNWNEPVGFRVYFTVELNSSVVCNTTNVLCSITGLTAGGYYTFNVSTFAGDGTAASSQISAFTKSDVVTNLNVSQKNTSSVSLNWNEPVGSRAYFTVELNSIVMCNTTNMSCSITGLTPGVNYTFTVSTFAGDGTAGTLIQISTFTMPDVVTNLNAFGKNTSSVSLTWNKPQGNWSLFRVEWAEGTVFNKDNTSKTSYTVTGLKSGRSYTFKVIVIAADHQTEGTPTEMLAATVPGPVTNLRFSEVTTSSVSLTWNNATGAGSYIVRWNNGTRNYNQSTNSTTYNATNLTPGVSYTFNVSAVAEDGQTEGESASNTTFTRPDAVTNLRVSEVTTSSVSLTWNKTNGAVSYRVRVNNGAGNNNGSTPDTTYTVTNLTPGVSYTFNVTAVAGDGQTEGESASKTTFTKPDGVTNLRVSEVTTSSVSLTWNNATGAKSYIVRWNNGTRNYNQSTNSTTYTATNLTPGVSYTFRVTAVAADNKTEGEAVAGSVYTKPDVVKSLTVSKVNASSMSLNWAEPTGEHSFYTVKWTNQTTIWSGTNNSFDISILVPGTNYTFAVLAVAGDNTTEGDPVLCSRCTDTRPVPGCNCGKTDGIATLNLSWKVPEGNNQGFNIILNQSISQIVTCSSGCNHTFSNLQFYHWYNMNISTLGCGESGIYNCSCQTGIGAPPVPKTWNISIIDITQRDITLSFSSSLLDNSNGPVEAYGVLLSTDSTVTNFTDGITKTYKDWDGEKTSTYLTVLKNATRLTRNNDIVIKIGIEDPSDYSDTDYKNGRLKSGQVYRVALVLFTKLTFSNKLVDISTSIFAASGSASGDMSTSAESKLGLILGVVFAIIVLTIVAVVLFVWQKRRAKKTYTDIPIDNIRTKVSIPVRVEDHEAYFRKQQSDSNCGFAEEYEDLKVVGTAQTKNSALAMENKGKNRYNNVLPYDSSRVKLSIHGSPFDDYINADYISGYNSKKEYIAAQGPLPTTVNEFWRMMWEKNVHTLVMLTKCYEQGRVKCEKYWPSESTLYNNIVVTTASEINLDDWTIRDFTIKNVKTAETREVRQFHFTAWPDHGVPETTEVLINFRHLVREHMDNYSRNSPTVVHCSAGVGRTGTFIALDHLIFQIERESMVDVFGIVHNMRMHRPLMVQTEDQYVFLNQSAFDIIKSRTGTNVDLIYQNAAAFSIYENL